MPRPRNPRPTYRLHKQSGQAIIRLTDNTGKRRDMLLGPYGSPDSKIEYDRIVADLTSKAAVHEVRRPSAKTPRHDLTVNELLLRFWLHAQQHYRRPDGTQTSELHVYSRAVKELRALFGDSPISEFGPSKLKEVRAAMIQAPLARDPLRTLSRGVVNSFVNRVRMIFRWGVSEELVPPDVLTKIEAVPAIKAGRTKCREAPKVGPVRDAIVDAVLPHVPRSVAGMIRLQRVSAMRPGETCVLRPINLNMTGDVWTYRPSRHKLSWLEKDRVVMFGPRAQAVIREFLTTNVTDFLFSPERDDPRPELRSRRTRPPGSCYTSASYARAVARGCRRANVPHWHPNQLRHSAATEIEQPFGIEAVGAVFGHTDVKTSRIYAERNLKGAARVAREIG